MEDIWIVDRLEKFDISEVNECINSLFSSDNIDERMDLATDIITILQQHDIDVTDFEDEIKDLAIN